MHATFLQKVVLAVLAGFGAACIIYLFTHVYQDANDSVNKNWKTTYSSGTKH